MFALEDVESIKKELTDEECSLHPLGAQEPFYFLCYRVLKENCDGDVVYLIFSLLLSMRLSRDKVETTCAQNLFFEHGSNIYCAGY